MAEIGALFMVGMLVGGIFNGVSVAKQACALSKNVCDVKQQIKDYTAQMENQDELLQLENVEVRQKMNSLIDSITQAHNMINVNYKNFRDTYNLFLVGSIIFIMLIIFALTFKKMVLSKL